MKLRIHRNSIRLRLNRREVAQFCTVGRLQEAFEYGPGNGDRLVYQIEASNTTPDIAVNRNAP